MANGSWIAPSVSAYLLRTMPVAMRLAKDYGLPADFAAGHRPRHFAGALDKPESVEVLLLLAEPGSTPFAWELRRSEDTWLDDVTSDGCGERGGHPFVYRPEARENYVAWPAEFLASIYPELSPQERMSRTVIANSFWMQAEKSAGSIPPDAERAFAPHLSEFINLFPNALVVAASRKAQRRVGLAIGKRSPRVIEMGALALPGYHNVRESHARAAAEVRRGLASKQSRVV